MRTEHVSGRSSWICAVAFLLALAAGSVQAGTVIFYDDFTDTADATQAELVSAVDTGTWVEVFIDTAIISSAHFHLGRGDYDYTAMFTHYGSVSAGGTIKMDLSFQDSIHDYNTVAILEGSTELFRIEVQTDDGGADGTDAQINLVGATTTNIAGGIRENSTPNRTFEFTLDATGVDLSITGDGLGSALTGRVDYATAPSAGPDRIRFFKNDVVGLSDRGQLHLDNLLVDFNSVVNRNVLVDFDDGNAGNGIHDAAVQDGDFAGQPNNAGVNAPWQSWNGGQFVDTQPSGIGGNLNGVIVSTREYAVYTGHRLAEDNVFNVEFFWRDASGWDPADELKLILYYTDNDAIDGTATEVFSLSSGSRDVALTWEGEHDTSPPFSDASGYGRKLFLKLDGTSSTGEFARFDNIYLERVGASGVSTADGTAVWFF